MMATKMCVTSFYTFVAFCIIAIQARPQTNLLIASTSQLPPSKVTDSALDLELQQTTEGTEAEDEILSPPIITKVHIRSDIQYRYSRTVAETSIKNPSTTKAQQVFFNMVLPDTAFISNFTIKLKGDDRVYVAKVAKKEEAKETYDSAVEQGQSVGLVNTDTRDANQIKVR